MSPLPEWIETEVRRIAREEAISAAAQLTTLVEVVNAPDPADQSQRTIQDIVTDALAQSTGARAAWLSPLAEEMKRMVQAAQDHRITDADLLQLLEDARRKLPDLFGRMDHQALAKSLEAAMGAAMVAGIESAL